MITLGVRVAANWRRCPKWTVPGLLLAVLMGCSAPSPATTEETSTPEVPSVAQSPGAPSPSVDGTKKAAEANVAKYFDLLATNDPDSCAKFANIDTSQARISNFTVNGTKVEGRITLGKGDRSKLGSLGSIQFVGAYRAITEDTLTATFVVRSRRKDVSMDTYGAGYRDRGGRQVGATGASGLTELDSHSSPRISLSFKKSKPGGTVNFEMWDDKTDASAKARVKIG